MDTNTIVLIYLISGLDVFGIVLSIFAYRDYKSYENNTWRIY